jgi:hypothetical protein
VAGVGTTYLNGLERKISAEKFRLLKRVQIYLRALMNRIGRFFGLGKVFDVVNRDKRYGKFHKALLWAHCFA